VTAAAYVMLRGPYTWGPFLKVSCAGCGQQMDDNDDSVSYAEPRPAEPEWYHGACWDAKHPDGRP
jgi:hypothetical protein